MARGKPVLPGQNSKLRAPSQGAGRLAKPKPSGGYVVRRGDTLSSIAKRNGTSVNALLKLNPKFKTNSKYRGGNTIFSGTKVRLR